MQGFMSMYSTMQGFASKHIRKLSFMILDSQDENSMSFCSPMQGFRSMDSLTESNQIK